MVDFPSKEKYNVDDFRRLVDVLRGEGGCPWDREQTHESLRRNMLEEAYEACGAIDSGDAENLREELGDVMLQVLLHARIASEEGLFDLDDVANAACQKLIYRHPHVFGATQVANSAEVLENWDVLKQKEKHQASLSDTMAGVTPALPALWRAEKCLKKAAKAGQGCSDAGAALEMLAQRAGALRNAAAEGGAAQAVGELLLAAVDAARLLDVDPEMALHGACEREIDAVRRKEAAR